MAEPVPEPPADRLKRLTMRSRRRGTREMDLILGPFAEACIGTLSAAELDLYEVLLEENDHDLYAWLAGRRGGQGAGTGPAPLHPLLDRIAAFALARLGPDGA